MSFLLDLLTQSTKLSLYIWWFPNDIQRVLEHLFKNRPTEEDVAGLLSLIMFAGVTDNEALYFQEEIISDSYTPKFNKNNPFIDSQQNLSVLLLGFTLDGVSFLFFGYCNIFSTNQIGEHRVLGFLRPSANAVQTRRLYQTLSWK